MVAVLESEILAKSWSFVMATGTWARDLHPEASMCSRVLDRPDCLPHLELFVRSYMKSSNRAKEWRSPYDDEWLVFLSRERLGVITIQQH